VTTRGDWLKWVAAAFALVATASAEYELARAIGMNQWIAAAVPGALDAYAVRALRAHREVLTAVVAMVGVNAASHLVSAGVLGVDWIMITAVSAIAPLVLWRVHALGTPGEWRTRKLWGVSVEEQARVLASTEPEPEHGRGNEDQGTPNEREHPEHSVSVAVTPASTFEEHAEEAVSLASTPAPEPFPYVWDDGHESTPVLRLVPDRAPEADTQEEQSEHTSTEQERGGHSERARSPRPITAQEHVSAGVLHPSDTDAYERAREHSAGTDTVPGVRALKSDLGTGTARAQRVRAALLIEHESRNGKGTS
jgi:hypothetical protein